MIINGGKQMPISLHASYVALLSYTNGKKNKKQLSKILLHTDTLEELFGSHIMKIQHF